MEIKLFHANNLYFACDEIEKSLSSDFLGKKCVHNKVFFAALRKKSKPTILFASIAAMQFSLSYLAQVFVCWKLKYSKLTHPDKCVPWILSDEITFHQKLFHMLRIRTLKRFYLKLAKNWNFARKKLPRSNCLLDENVSWNKVTMANVVPVHKYKW